MSATAYTPTPTGGGWKAQVQRVGAFLAGMIMPNIGAFIAWGLITALFIGPGWLPNEALAEAFVGPIITIVLPLLIGYTGGRMVHGQRGAVIGAIATFGIVAGTSVPMFMGAMFMGPLSGWLLKQFDAAVAGRIRTGFEMLVDNFSLGILGTGIALAAYYAFGPVFDGIIEVIGNGVDVLVSNSLLPVVSVLVEPAKVLFLNNAINFGVFAPIGAVETEEFGKSIMFMIETNPGPGLGILIAYWLAGPRNIKASIPGAAIIHFLGGIHEIYFPYVLMKPRMILAAIAGGATGVATFMITGSGLIATPSPGSIFAWLAVMPRGEQFGPLLGIALSTVVSAAVGTVLLKTERKVVEDEEIDLAAAEAETQARKAESKAGVTNPTTAGA